MGYLYLIEDDALGGAAVTGTRVLRCAGAFGGSGQWHAAGAAAEQSQEVGVGRRLVHQACQLRRRRRLRGRPGRRARSAQRLLPNRHTLPRPPTVRKVSFTHTHTHTFNGPLSGTTRVSWCQKGKTNLDFSEARDSEWQRHQLGYMQAYT